MLDETRARSLAPVFEDIASQTFAGNPSYASQLIPGTDYWRTVLDGACGIDIYGHNGVSFADIDGDGFDDLYVCQPAGLPNRLFRNRADGTFEDITAASGLGILENTACALFADFDNDGRQDVIIVRTGGPLLFLNQGGGKFRAKARCIPLRHAAARRFYRSGRRRLRSRRLAGHLFLPVRLLPGRRSIPLPVSLLRCGERSAEFHDAQQSRRNFSRCHQGIRPRSQQHAL